MNRIPEFKPEKLVSIDDLDLEDIRCLFEVTKGFMKDLKTSPGNLPNLNNFTVANLFFEDSTRTRFSFEIAEKRLSIQIVNFSPSSSSIKKGETLLDTIKNIQVMGIDLIVLRDRTSGVAKFVFDKTGIPVINAGDGTNEHPTQALLDLFTIWNQGLETDKFQIVLKGDQLHSRVARSSIKLWNKLGIKYQVSGPRTVISKFSNSKSEMKSDRACTIIYNLRIQKERLNKELIPGPEEYNTYFGFKDQNLTPPHFIMHPGPINRNVELISEVADSANSLILEQVQTGVAVRMALLYLLNKKKGR